MRFKQLITNQLTEISDETITSLRYYAFYNLSNLESVSLPNLKQGVYYGFAGCSKLTNVYLPNMYNGNSLFGRYMFSGCTSLKFIELPKVNRVVYTMFANCSNLETISSTNLSLIENYSVSGCSKLSNLVLKGNRVTSLESADSLNGTPFKTGNNGGGTAYVPKNLIINYQADAVWIQIPYVTFLAIEDNIEKLRALGADVSDYEEATE
ncbi:MAG: leucine-rich repeat protein [Eubacterium sp.]|nr:leucine-rich repeat protein [Eubacterium sp.]